MFPGQRGAHFLSWGLHQPALDFFCLFKASWWFLTVIDQSAYIFASKSLYQISITVRSRLSFSPWPTPAPALAVGCTDSFGVMDGRIMSPPLLPPLSPSSNLSLSFLYICFSLSFPQIPQRRHKDIPFHYFGTWIHHREEQICLNLNFCNIQVELGHNRLQAI